MHPSPPQKHCIKAVGDIDTGGPEGRPILVAVQYYDDGSTETVPQRPDGDPEGFIFATDQHANQIAERKAKFGE